MQAYCLLIYNFPKPNSKRIPLKNWFLNSKIFVYNIDNNNRFSKICASDIVVGFENPITH